MLDRDLQKKLLLDLSTLYPRSADLLRSWKDINHETLVYNLYYLHDHGLVKLVATKLLSGKITLHNCTITVAGIDFISDDGGLSSILGVVTVKLHEDTIKALLIEKIEHSGAAPSVKKKMIDQVKSLPAEMTKTATLEALKAGLDSLPDAVQWLHKLLSP